jgi:putative PIN family toxin of toxin-antitoxin system
MSRSRKQVVLDTNLVVSAFLSPKGAAAQALLLALDHFEVVCSQETFAELIDVLSRDKFDAYASRAERVQRLEAYGQAVWFRDVSSQITDCRDPKDNKFLALALDAEAALIVTGDKRDLLSMHPYQGVAIVGLRAFIDRHAELA